MSYLHSEGGRRMTVKLPWTCQGCFTSWEFVWWNLEYQDECPSCTADMEDRIPLIADND